MQFLDGRPGSPISAALISDDERWQLRQRMLRLYSDEADLAMKNPGMEVRCQQRYTLWETLLQLCGIAFTPKLGEPPIIVYYETMGLVFYQGAARTKA